MRLGLDRPLTIDPGEAARWLRAKGDPALQADTAEVWERLRPLLKPAAAAVCHPLERRGERLFTAGLELPGKSIAAHFTSCGSCITLGVTIGFEADRLISSLGQTDPYRALLADACASAAVERLADMAAEAACRQFGPGGRATSRFSPGYGDMPLDLQPKLLELIDARRMLGLTVSGSMLLSPVKSVTAFIGLEENPHGCQSGPRPGCAGCSMRGSCQYRAADGEQG